MSNAKYIIGDLVRISHDTHTFKVTECHNDGTLRVRGTDEKETSERTVHEEDIEPIPLTPQLVMDNGWRITPFGRIFLEKYRREGTEIYLYNMRDGHWKLVVGEYQVPLMYIHQFQHILFGLGMPMEITMGDLAS